MTRSAQELSDRAEISEVVLAYARALDRRDSSLMRSILTDPVAIDYTSWSAGLNVPAMPADEWVNSVKSLAAFDATQHISANHHTTLDGDRARCVSYMQASHFLKRDGASYDCTLFGFYTNDLVRTEDGWRLCGVKLDVTARQGDERVFGWAFGGGAARSAARDFVIYGAAISPFAQRVMMQLRAKGVVPPLRDPPGGLHSDEFRAISPIDKVPVLAVGGRHIPESAVIADWIEDTHPLPALRPADPLERAAAAVVARIADIYVMNRMLPLFANMDPKTRDAAVVARTLADVDQGLDWLTHHLSDTGFAAGATFTLADCACTPILWYARQFMPAFGAPDPIAARPKLAAYWARVTAHPAAAATTAGLAAALAALRQG